MAVRLCLVALVICAVNSLSVEEAKKFHNSGQYKGSVSYTDNGDSITLTSNGLPDHPYVRVNPNDPVARHDVYTLPKNPTMASQPGCLSMGPIGMAITGAMIFDPLNKDGENAVEGSTAEHFDQYGGHTQQTGIYHYHKLPTGNWLYNGQPDELIGVAFDGFPIYGPFASDLNRDVTNNDLDKCHGRMVNGKYRYHVNSEFPYYLGCYMGSTVNHAHTTFGQCPDKSEFDDQWGYACTCPHNGPMGGQHTGTHMGTHTDTHTGEAHNTNTQVQPDGHHHTYIDFFGRRRKRSNLV